MSITFYMPVEIFAGAGGVDRVGRLAAKRGKRVLIVTDGGVSRALGVVDRVGPVLRQAGLDYEVYDGVEANPSVENVSAGARLAVRYRAEVILAVGGGSVLDGAKGIAIVTAYGKTIWDYIGEEKVPGPVAPVIAVPTTSGTGSETTPFGVYSRRDTREKEGLCSRYIFPAAAILDPLMTRSLPPGLTAETGLDALAHAIESYTGKSANPVAEALAEKAIELIGRSLVGAVADGSDLSARQDMAWASALAGMSITHGGVGAAHGFGMSIGALFEKPHGRVIGMLLAPVMGYNQAVVPERYQRIARILRESRPEFFGGAEDAPGMVARLVEETGVPVKLGSLGLTGKDLPAVVDDCLRRGDFANNARPFAREDALRFLEQCL